MKGRLSTLQHESEVHSEKQQRNPKPNVQKMSKDSDGPSSNEESDIEQETDERLQLEDLNDKTVLFEIYSILILGYVFLASCDGSTV